MAANAPAGKWIYCTYSTRPSRRPNLLHIPQLVLINTIVTIRGRTFPGHNGTITKHSSKLSKMAADAPSEYCICCASPDALEQLLLPLKPGWPPCHNNHRPNCQQTPSRILDLLRIPQLLLNSSAVATTARVATRHNQTMVQIGSKRPSRKVDLLHIPQLLLNSGAVATTAMVAQRHNKP